MHVLMLTCDLLQIDRRILHEAETLAHAGHEVTIFCINDDVIEPARVPEGINIMKPSIVRNSSGRMRDYLKNKFIDFLRRILPVFIKEILLFVVLQPAQRIATAFSKFKFKPWDVVIAHDLPVLPLALALRQSQGDGRIIFDAHELYEEQHDHLYFWGRLYWSKVARNHVSKVDSIMTVTPNLAIEIQRRYVWSRPVTVLYNSCPYIPFDSSLYKERPKLLHDLYHIDHHRKIVLCQGGGVSGRNLEDFIYAWQYLQSPRPALVFLGFGKKEYWNRLKKIVLSLKLEKDVFVGKAVCPDKVLEYTQSASLGLISNRGVGLNNTDGAPNRFFEYVQARVPIFSYTHTGIEGLLKDTQTGWTARWETASELSKFIGEMLDKLDTVDSKHLEWAAAKLSWENQQDKFLKTVLNN